MTKGLILGENWNEVAKPRSYFIERNCFIDCRGKFVVARSSVWGFNVTVLTASHNISRGAPEEMILKEVIVGHLAWIASNVILYNCVIEEGAVVSVGSVVRNMTVAAWTMVEGNPAQVIKKFDNGRWERISGISSQDNSWKS